MTLECFYTLPNSIEDYRIIWRIEPQLRERVNKLHQIIDPLSELNAEILEARIACYLFEELQQHPELELLQQHWIAFLVRRCEKVAKQFAYLGSSYFQDLVLMGAEVASHPVNFFENFDSQHCQIEYWYPTLKRFSDSKIKHFIIPKFRDSTGQNTIGLSNLGLAARSSRKRVKEALVHSGYGQTELCQYLLVWQCFQEVRNSHSFGANQFQLEHFQEVARRYWEFSEELALPEVQELDINGEEIKTTLENIGRAIRQLLDPPIDSLDAPLYSQANENISLLENILYQPSVDDEINQLVAALRDVISHLLEELNQTQAKQLLFLRYGLELRQTQVGQELHGQPQYRICRLLQELNSRLLTEIRIWIKQPLQRQPSSEELNEIEAVLCQYYAKKIDVFFCKSNSFFWMAESRDIKTILYR